MPGSTRWRRFFEVLSELLAANKAGLAASKAHIAGSDDKEVIGWREGDRVFLFPQRTYGAVAKALAELGEDIPVGEKMFWRRAREAGMLCEVEPGRATTRRHVNGSRTYVIAVGIGTLGLDNAANASQLTLVGAPVGSVGPVAGSVGFAN